MSRYTISLTAVSLLAPLCVFASVVNINTADLETLQTLTGIGAVKAQAIIDYREQHGLFKVKTDILNVTGIGEVTYNNIKNDIVVDSVV